MKIEFELIQVGLISDEDGPTRAFLRHPKTGEIVHFTPREGLAWVMSSVLGVPYTVPIAESA